MHCLGKDWNKHHVILCKGNNNKNKDKTHTLECELPTEVYF